MKSIFHYFCRATIKVYCILSIFSIFILKQSSKWCLIFYYFFGFFEKLVNISQQELSFNHIVKECLISKDIGIIRKKAGIVLTSVYSSCTAENFKAIL